MNVKIKKDKNNEWGMVESFQVYKYDTHGTITATAIVGVNGELVKPFCYRKEEFIPASQIEEEMGIDKYLTAKKPFYSKVSEGFPVKIVSAIDFITGEIDKKKSYCDVFMVSSTKVAVNSGSIALSRVLNKPRSLELLCEDLIERVASCKGNREVFLKSRFGL